MSRGTPDPSSQPPPFRLAPAPAPKEVQKSTVEHAPGTRFCYNTGASYMLAAIVQKVSGQTLLGYLTPRLLGPLGIEGATWDASPQGIAFGGFGLSVKTEDMARFGQLYLQKGRWQGRQILPPAFVEAATAVQIATPGGGDWGAGYGYQFWRCTHNAYRADGMFGQECIVIPDHDCVVVTTSATDRLGALFEGVWEHLLPAVGGRLGGDAAFRARLAALTLAPGTAAAGPPGAPALSGQRHMLAPNEADLEAIELHVSADACRVTLRQGGRETGPLECGFGTWRSSQAIGPRAGAAPCSGWASWEPDGTLRLDWYFVHAVHGVTLRIMSRAGGGVAVDFRPNVGGHAQGLTVHSIRSEPADG